MQDLIAKISSLTGLDVARAERALGIMLSLVKTQGDPAKTPELFANLPGAEDLATKFGGDGAGRKGGLFGMLGGGAMGGPLAAIAKLQAAGLNMDQIKILGSETLDYAKRKAGPNLVKQAVGAIPGLSGYV
jgi:hypothetical protein